MKLHEVVGKINDEDLSDYVFAPVNEMAFNAEILKRERVLAFKIHELEEAYIDLKKAGTPDQEKDASKRAQADYEYIRARLAADPWTDARLLVIKSVQPWAVLLDGRGAPQDPNK